MPRKVNGWLIAGTLVLYVWNQFLKQRIPSDALRLFMAGYFNDIIGSITFPAYVNVVMSFRGISVEKLWQIELMMLGCGIFWEVITPLFRKSTVADIWDMAAYLAGGFLYWGIAVFYKYVCGKKRETQGQSM